MSEKTDILATLVIALVDQLVNGTPLTDADKAEMLLLAMDLRERTGHAESRYAMEREDADDDRPHRAAQPQYTLAEARAAYNDNSDDEDESDDFD